MTVGFVSVGVACAVVVALIVAGSDGGSNSGTTTRASYFRSAAWRFVQTLVIGVCFVSFVWRSLRSHEGPDAVAASYLIIVLVVAVVPWVSKIVFPQGEVDFIDGDAKNDVLALEQNAQEAQLAMARAAQYVSEMQASLSGQLRTMPKTNVSGDSVKRALYDASESLSVWLRPLPAPPDASPDIPPAPPEQIRISAWMAEAKGTQLRFFHGWPTKTTKELDGIVVKLQGDQVAGVFEMGITRSYRFLPEDQRPPHGRVPYNGILITPIFAGGSILGVLQVEREKMEVFAPAQVAIAKASAALYATSS